MATKYEVLPEMVEESGQAKLSASWTANNGRRIQIVNWFDEADRENSMLDGEGWDNYYRVFDLTKEQARQLGEALLRWANQDH